MSEPLATGVLTKTGPGVWEGTIHIPVRGDFPMRLANRTTDAHGTRYAEFTIDGRTHTVLHTRGADGEDVPHWHTVLTVTGYAMRLRIVGLGVELHDTVQTRAGA